MKEGRWKKPEDQKGRAFSIVKCNTEFGKENIDRRDNFVYVILINGMRRENYSKTGKSSENTGWGISKFLSVIDNCDLRVKVENVLVDNDAPLEEQAKLIARYINKLKGNENCKKIHILGMSKCGCVSVALLKYLDNTNLEKLNIMAYSAPYLGTIYASPVTLYHRIDEVINSIEKTLLNKIIPILQKIRPNKKVDNKSNALVDVIKKIHWNVFSQSHMDYDIAEISGKGVPEKHRDRYDEKFLREMFDDKTLSMLKKVDFTNITTYCTENTLRKALKNGNITNAMLYLSDKVIFKGEVSDGMVKLESAQYIEKVCEQNNINISKMRILDGHHNIGGDLDIIQTIVSDKIMGNYKEIEER